MRSTLSIYRNLIGFVIVLLAGPAVGAEVANLDLLESANRTQASFLKQDARNGSMGDVVTLGVDSRSRYGDPPFSVAQYEKKVSISCDSKLKEVKPLSGKGGSVLWSVHAINQRYGFVLMSDPPSEKLLLEACELTNLPEFDLAEIGYPGSFRRPSVTPRDDLGFIHLFHLQLSYHVAEILKNADAIRSISKEGSVISVQFEVRQSRFSWGAETLSSVEPVIATIKLDETYFCLPVEVSAAIKTADRTFSEVNNVVYTANANQITSQTELHQLQIVEKSGSVENFALSRDLQYKYEPIPCDEFTLSHYGFPEPVDRSRRPLVVAIFAVVVAIIVILVARHRSRTGLLT